MTARTALPRLAWLLPGVLALAGCGSPEGRVQAFFEQVESDMFTAAMIDLHDATMEKRLPRFQVAEALREEHEHISRCGGIQQVDVRLSGVEAHRNAQVTLNFRGMCSPQASSVDVLKDGWGWKIAFGERWPPVGN
jgi:hypothetical protein